MKMKLYGNFITKLFKLNKIRARAEINVQKLKPNV